MDAENNAKLDMSLDDIIKMERIKGPRRFGSGRRNNNRYGGNRSFNQKRFNGGFPSFANRNISRRHRFQNRPRPLNNRSYQPALLHISNLALTVTSDDLNELFSSFGNLYHAFVHYDQYGASLCTAEVEFERKDEAIEARNKLNNVLFDGKPLRITLINKSNDDAFTSFLKSTASQNNRNRGRNDFGRRFNNRKSNQNLTADDLDRDLDEWRMKSEENNIGQMNGNDNEMM